MNVHEVVELVPWAGHTLSSPVRSQDILAVATEANAVAVEVDEHVFANSPANLRQSAILLVYVSSAVEDAVATPKSNAMVFALIVAYKF